MWDSKDLFILSEKIVISKLEIHLKENLAFVGRSTV
jgi:hypothetical protein